MKTIPLTKGFQAKVDDGDYEFLMQWKWHASLTRCGLHYAKRIDTSHGNRICILMHRLLVCAKEGDHVDHADRDTLNNQRVNLRIATQSENCANRNIGIRNKSGFKGVYWSKQHNMWRVNVGNKGHILHFGLFKNVLEAAHAYDDAAIRVYGDFAATNSRLGLL